MKIPVFRLIMLLSLLLKSAAPIEIPIDIEAESLGSMIPALLGANNPMPFMTGRAGYQNMTNSFPGAFTEAIKQSGVRSFRFPGGNVSGGSCDSFKWNETCKRDIPDTACGKRRPETA